jgi:hypothetical protein
MQSSQPTIIDSASISYPVEAGCEIISLVFSTKGLYALQLCMDKCLLTQQQQGKHATQLSNT